jgi:DNA-binding NarL/FixJ family response regulator
MPVTVFVVDDHAVVREGLIALLATHSDIQIVGAAVNGREAIGEIPKLKPQIAILDISMPDLDGIETTRQLVAEAPETAVIILSMHSGSQHVFHALRAGAKAYLLKESAGREIVDAIRSVRDGRRFLSPKIAQIVEKRLGHSSFVSPLDSLSTREREVVKLVADGFSSNEIAKMLCLSSKTVDSYRSRLMHKLHVSDVAGLVKFAIQHGITSLDY